MIRYATLALAAAAFLGQAAAAKAADLQRGAVLAQQWCANCHLIGAGTPSSAQQGPPPFRSIAAMPPDQIRTFLTKPHGSMPDLSLSRAEIDDLIAYIGSLK